MLSAFLQSASDIYNRKSNWIQIVWLYFLFSSQSDEHFSLRLLSSMQKLLKQPFTFSTHTFAGSRLSVVNHQIDWLMNWLASSTNQSWSNFRFHSGFIRSFIMIRPPRLAARTTCFFNVLPINAWWIDKLINWWHTSHSAPHTSHDLWVRRRCCRCCCCTTTNAAPNWRSMTVACAQPPTQPAAPPPLPKHFAQHSLVRRNCCQFSSRFWA